MKKQATGPAGGLEELFDFSFGELVTALNDVLQFSGTVGTEDEVVVFGMIVNRFDDSFNFARQDGFPFSRRRVPMNL